jgi:hypothetical protein
VVSTIDETRGPGAVKRRRPIGADGPRRPRHPRLFRPTTWAAGLTLLATGVVAAVVWSLSSTGVSLSSGAVAARVGPSVITNAQVRSEVDAILAVPTYRQSLQGLGTISLSAPVSPKAVANATGDPDDLLITFAPAKGTSTTRPFTRADLAASVLTRMLYVTSLEQLLAERHLVPSPGEMADGRAQARVESGFGPGGASIFSTLPAWYQNELTERAADVEALALSIAGPNAVTVPAVEAYYFRVALSQFTEVCLHRVAISAAGSPHGREVNEGCAPMADWTPWVAAAVSHLPVGVSTSPVRHDSRTFVLKVASRTVQPLSAVSGSVIAEMLQPYTDVVDDIVTTHLGIEKVAVASQFGTYENLGTTFGVLPPDALAPASPLPKTGAKRHLAPLPQQQFDPFS